MNNGKPPHAALPLPALAFAALCGTALALTTVPGPATAGEIEPNDTFAAANATGLIDAGTVLIAGAFIGDGDAPNHDVDLYALEIAPGAATPRILSVSVDKDADAVVDLFLRIFDATGREIGVNDDRNAANSDPQRTAYLIEPGIVYIGVSAAANPRYDPILGTIFGDDEATGESGGYALSIALADAPIPTSPYEPNDDFPEATPLGSASFVIADEFLGDGPNGWGDADYYRLNVTSPAKIDIEVRAASIGSPINPSVGLWTNSEPLGFMNGTEMAGTDSVKTFLIPRPMEVTLVVAGLPERVHGPMLLQRETAGAAGPYGLFVNVEYLGLQTETPPNDSIRSATPVPAFVALPGRPDTWETTGFVGDGPYAQARGDRDFYRIDLQAESRLLRITAEPTPGSGLDPLVAFYDAKGTLVAGNDNRGGADPTAELLLPTPCRPVGVESATGFVMVAGTRQRAMANPDIPWPGEHHLEDFVWGAGPGSTGAYHLTLDISTEPTSCLNEPDDTLADATPTGLIDEGLFYCSGASAADSLCPDGPQFDVDIWSVEVRNAPIHMTASMFSECFTDPVFDNTVYLFNQAGQELTRGASSGSGVLCDLEYSLHTPGTYFVAFRGESAGGHPFDPNESCTGFGTASGTYSAVIQLSRGNTPAPPEGATASAPTGPPEPTHLFATSIEGIAPVIDVIDTATGTATATMPAPEPFGGAEGLASDGSQLFFMGSGWFPWLYELDPLTGTVLDAFTLWAGSGIYSDMALLGSELFVLDLMRQSVHVFDLSARRWDRTLRIGPNNNVPFSGAMAALAGPSRLFLAGATDANEIHVAEPERGALVRSMAIDESAAALAGMGSETLFTATWGASDMNILSRQGTLQGSISQSRPVSSLGARPDFGPFVDFDADGDVDLSDFAAMAICFSDAPWEPCTLGDGDENGLVDLADYAGFAPRMTGP